VIGELVGAQSVRRFALAALPVILFAQCAPQCAPTPAPAPVAPTTTTVAARGPLTVTYEAAGPGAPRIGLIGDSTLASIRWTGAWAPLREWNYTYDAEACRRTITTSCHGADGYTPDNALEVMHRLDGQLGSVLVVMLGANDPVTRFDDGIDAVVAEARAQHIGRVIWLTVPGSTDRNDILAQRAAQHGGYLVVADWAGFSAAHPEWFIADALHLNASGAPLLSQYIADAVAHVVG
jgi:hypothetical protein